MDRCCVSLPRVTGTDWRPAGRSVLSAHHDRRLSFGPAGGQLSVGQLRTAGEVSQRHAGDGVAVSGQQFQLLLARPQDHPAVAARLWAAGMAVACVPDQAARAFVGSPVAGIAADEIVDGTRALQEIRDRCAGQARFRALPRTFTTTVSGSPRQDVLHEASDVSFTGVWHPGLGPGFDVRVGGIWPARPVRAGRLGVFVTVDEVAAVWTAIADAFCEFGCRRPDRRERLALLIADGEAAAFRRVIEREYLHHRLADGLVPPPPAGPRDHIGVHAQRDGRCYVGVTPATSGPSLTALADLAEAHGSARVRITPYQKLVVLDVPPGRVESFCHSLERIGLTGRPALSHRRSADWWRA
jgi:sulfite reductase (ferredoxin)